jgi:GDP-L-fucose synthase
LETAHVLPALLQRFHKAKVANSHEVKIWGDGTALREFLHVEDMARACLLLIDSYDSSKAINVGSGEEISIRDLAILISKVVGFQGELTFDSNRPNGTPRKILDSSLISQMGWKPQISLENGIASTYDWFVAHLTEEINR